MLPLAGSQPHLPAIKPTDWPSSVWKEFIGGESRPHGQERERLRRTAR